MRWYLIIGVVALAGGGCSKDAPPPVDKVPDKDDEVRECVARLTGLSGGDVGIADGLVPRACDMACPVQERADGYIPYRESAEACGLFCSDAARARYAAAPKRDRWQVLVQECGADYYGLPAGYPGALNAKWFLMYKLSQWTQRVRPDTSAALFAQLENRLSQLPFEVDARAFVPAGMDLPEQNTVGSRTALIVQLQADRLAAGAMPHARFAAGGALAIEQAPGGEMTPLSLDTLPAHLTAVAARMPAHLYVDLGLRVVLVMADDDTPAQAALEVVGALDHMVGKLAVRDPETGQVGSARLWLVPSGAEEKSSTAPARVPIDVQVTDAGYRVSAPTRPRTKAVSVTLGSRDGLAAAVTGLLPDGAKAELWLSATPHATVGHLAEAMAVIGDVRAPDHPDPYRRRWTSITVRPR